MHGQWLPLLREGHGAPVRLHFGCGPNKLPSPWQNFDRDVDIAKPLPFEDCSAACIFAEHVIEHVPFVDGLGFLTECRRVLVHGGVLRFGFPDVTRITNEESVQSYLQYLRGRRRRAEGRADVFRFIMADSGHRSCWTREMGEAAVVAMGFRVVASPNYGESFFLDTLRGVDGHHKTSSVAHLETTVLEAQK